MQRVPNLRPMRKGLNLVIACFAVFAAGCGSSDSDSTTAGGSDSGSERKQIAFLLPQTGVPRFERFDKPHFEEAVKKHCPECDVLYRLKLRWPTGPTPS